MSSFNSPQARVLSSASRSGSDVKSIPKIYANALGHYVRGFLQWCFETEYFFGDEGERIRVTLKVPIDEDEGHQAEGEDTNAPQL